MAAFGGGVSCLHFNLTFVAVVLLAALLALKRVSGFVTRFPLAAILCLGIAAAAPLGLFAHKTHASRPKTVTDSKAGEVTAPARRLELAAQGSGTGQSVQETVNDDAGMAAWRRGVEAALKNARDPAPPSAPPSASAQRPAESGSLAQAATIEQAKDAPEEQPDAAARPHEEDAANPHAEKTIDPFANSPVIDHPGRGRDDGSVWGNGPIGVIPFVKPEGPPFGQMRVPNVPRHFWEVRRFSFWRGAHRVAGIARSGW
jgi:hypothetical protein